MSSTPRGLATLALLKTRFDQGRDHIELLEPFVLDSLSQIEHEHCIAQDLQPILEARSGLRLPNDAITTVLNRLRKRGVLTRDGGRFFIPKHKVARSTLDADREAILARQRRFASQLRAYVGEHGVTLVSDDDALATLAAFVTDNKVPLLLNEPLADSPLERSSLPRKTTRVIARFIREHALQEGESRAVLEGLIEGMVLQDTLLLRDVTTIAQRFRGLFIVLDTPILFAALDLTGSANGVATREGLALFRDAGAVNIVFDRTIGEMRRILAVYEEHLATAEGRLSLYPTELTHFVLQAKMSPGDVRIISATLTKRLASIGVVLREVPKRVAAYTLDEQKLAMAIANSDDLEKPRVRHDVDCIAGVLTLRASRTSAALESSTAIFCTTSGKLVRNAQKWYFDEGERGTPPLAHQLALTSIAWLKRPTAAKGIKLHELAAVCSAALRPTRNTWHMFITNLKQMRADGVLSDDETVAIVASEMTEPLLSSIDDDLDPDADTIAEAIERVRARYRDEAESKADVAIRNAKHDAAIAAEVAANAVQRSSELEASIELRVQALSGAAASTVFSIGVGVLIGSAILSFPNVFDSIGGIWKGVARGILVLSGAFGAYTSISGPNLAEIRSRTRAWFAEHFRPWLMPPPTHTSVSTVGSGSHQPQIGPE